MRRLWCVLTGHREKGWMRHEWEFSGRVVWMRVCDCGTQLDEGNSDGWIIPDWIARDLERNARASMDSIFRDVLRG